MGHGALFWLFLALQSLALLSEQGWAAAYAGSANNAPGRSDGAGDVAPAVTSLSLPQVNHPLEQTLKAGEKHTYRVDLERSQFLELSIEPGRIPLKIRWLGPDGNAVLPAEALPSDSDPKTILWVADAKGSYQLTVEPPDPAGAGGAYKLDLRALQSASERDRTRFLAQQSYNNGERLLLKGTAEQLRQSFQSYQEALSLAQKARDRTREAQALDRMGYSQRLLSDGKNALENLKKALALWKELGNQFGLAETLNNLGVVYNLLGDPRKALESFQQARAVCHSVGNRIGEATTLLNVAFTQKLLGENRAALDGYLEAIPILRASGDRRMEGIVLSNLAAHYQDIGEVQKALDYYDQSLAAFNGIGASREEAKTLSGTGSLYQRLGEESQALNYYNRSLALRRLSGDRQGEAITLNNIGAAYRHLGEHSVALEKFSQALRLQREIGDRQAEVSTLNNVGGALRALNRVPESLQHHQEALELSRTIASRSGEAESLEGLGQALIESQQPNAALDRFTEAQHIWKALGQTLNEARSRRRIAQAHRELGQLAQARTDIEKTLELLESLRSKIISSSLRSGLFSLMRDSYESYIELLMALHAQSPSIGLDIAAFNASERAHARGLLELLNEAGVDLMDGISPQLLARKNQLQQQLNAKAEAQMRLRNAKNGTEQAATITSEIESLAIEYDRVLAQIRSASPRYSELTAPNPLTLPQVQQLIDDDGLLLEYMLGDGKSFLWAITRTTFQAIELPPRKQIESTARELYELLIARNKQISGERREARWQRIERAERQVSKTAAALSKVLVSPVESELKTRRLLIVADGALEYLPFSVLRAGPQQRLLALDHEIVNLPSINAVTLIRREASSRPLASKPLAIIADPVFDDGDPRLKKVTANAGTPVTSDARAMRDMNLVDPGGRIRRLPFTRREAEAIASLLPEHPMMALDFAASKETVLGLGLGEYETVHFATHAFVHSEHPELSGLVLSLFNKKGERQDGFLRLNEIYNLHLTAKRVVLSACQTALGKQIRGDGLIGLTRGFMYAGASQVIATLWQVDDAASFEFMKIFYDEMLVHHRRAPSALRAAQEKMAARSAWKSAFYWAPFVVYGDWQN